MKRIITTIALGVATAMAAPAQTAYTLNECISQALANNTKLRNAQNSIQMAEQQRKEAFTNYFPTVQAAGGGFTANKGLVELDLMGMSLSFVKNGLTASVTAMQPVFAGGQIVNGNRLAKVGEDVSRLQYGLTENEVRLTTETYFWQIVMLKEKLRTLDRADAQVENAHKDAQAAVEAGLRNRNDLLQVELKQNELRASRIKVDNALGLVRQLLAQQMGTQEGSVDVAFTVGDALPESPESLYAEPEQSLLATKEYQLLGKQVEAERLNYKMTVGKQLPTVAVGGGYFYNDLMDKSSNRWMGMLTVSVPLSKWWGGTHAMKRQKLQLQNAENTRKDQGEMLIIRMRSAWNDMTDAYKQVAIAQESIHQSEENLRLNTDYYQAGTAAISDLLDAQTLYQQARDSFVEAYMQYEVKRTEYLQATGR